MPEQAPTSQQNAAEAQEPFGANEVRLSPRQWLVAAFIVSFVLVAIAPLWRLCESFVPVIDYRVPFELSNDYWTYDRLATKVSDDPGVLVIGDSVVWGEYVKPDQTLPHELTRWVNTHVFFNGGISGAHPLALEGLVRDYATNVRSRHVILHCNLLWMTSPERDLSAKTDKEVAFNHPTLVPQFVPRVPVYRASVSDRMGVVLDRNLPWRSWVNHTRVAYFDGLDVHTWSMEHPYEDPLRRLSWETAVPSNEPRHGDPPPTWEQQGMEAQAMPWVEPAESLQWSAFQRTVRLLQGRGNRVFVVVGPLNEHMLTEGSRESYRSWLATVDGWLSDQGVAHQVAPLLPRDEYGDASHPLAAGYARMAENLVQDSAFAAWLGRGEGVSGAPGD